MQQLEEARAPLLLYVQYEYLPVRHAAAILDSFSRVHEAVLIALRKQSTDWGIGLASRSAYELCVDTVHTGHSLEFGFAPKGKILPRIVFRQDKPMLIQLPRWIAPAIMAGSVVLGGAEAYDRYLDMELKHIEIQLKQRELDEPTLELERQLRAVDVDAVMESPQVVRWAERTRAQLSRPNIQAAEINGIKVPPARGKASDESKL